MRFLSLLSTLLGRSNVRVIGIQGSSATKLRPTTCVSVERGFCLCNGLSGSQEVVELDRRSLQRFYETMCGPVQQTDSKSKVAYQGSTVSSSTRGGLKTVSTRV